MDDNNELTNKAIKEIMNDVRWVKLTEGQGKKPNKTNNVFLQRTLNSMLVQNTKKDKATEEKCLQKLHELNEYKRRRRHNAFFKRVRRIRRRSKSNEQEPAASSGTEPSCTKLPLKKPLKKRMKPAKSRCRKAQLKMPKKCKKGHNKQHSSTSDAPHTSSSHGSSSSSSGGSTTDVSSHEDEDKRANKCKMRCKSLTVPGNFCTPTPMLLRTVNQNAANNFHHHEMCIDNDNDSCSTSSIEFIPCSPIIRTNTNTNTRKPSKLVTYTVSSDSDASFIALNKKVRTISIVSTSDSDVQYECCMDVDDNDDLITD